MFQQLTDTHERPIRSYVRRQGRMTKGQTEAINRCWEAYGIEVDKTHIDLQAQFGNDKPIVLDIGFGMGEALIKQALAEPHLNFLGVEVHEPGVGACIASCEANQLQNIRIICADVVDVLNFAIPDAQFCRVQIFFPDPWHKKRHNKRRIIQPEFVKLLQQKLIANGVLHCATDWQEYAEYMMEVLTAADKLYNQAGPQAYSPRPESRPLTKFESRGHRLGHGVWDLLFENQAD